MMSSNKKSKETTYEELSKKYSDQEIVEYFVFPSELSASEREEANKEFLQLRMEHLNDMTESEVMLGELMRMKFQIENYLNASHYSDSFAFHMQLKEYMRITKRSQADLCHEIGIDKTKMSKLVNGKLRPSIEICYRLEKHSDNLLPAKYWYKLHLRKLEKQLDVNDKLKKAEYNKVKSSLSLGLTG